MPAAEWRAAYRVGVESVDRQHEGLIVAVNELERAYVGGAGREAVTILIDRLARLAHAHFDHERALLEPRGGAGFAAHMTEHKMIADWLEGLQLKIRAGALDSPSRQLGVLRAWVETHVAETDLPAFREV